MTHATKRPPKVHTGDPPAGLTCYLERDQLVADASRPVPRARLSRRASAGLWALRIFVIAIGAMVIYTFFAQLI